MAFVYIIADMLISKKHNPVVTELFIKGWKLKISYVFTAQSYCAIPKNVRLNSMLYFIMRVPNKQERQQSAFHHSSNIDFKYFFSLYKSMEKPYSFLVIDAALASDNPSCFRKNLLGRK